MGQFAQPRACCDSWVTPFSKGKRIFAQGLAGLVERALHTATDMKGEKEETNFTKDNPGGSTLVFEGQCASKVLHSAVSVEVGMDTRVAEETGRLLMC